MFELLTQILLWLLIGYTAWWVLKQVIPEKTYTFLGFVLLLAMIVLAFMDPTQEGIVSQAWNILALPFRPLGLAIIFMFQSLGTKDLLQAKTYQQPLSWALILLLVFSAPFTAYELYKGNEQEVVSFSQMSAGQTSNIIVLLAQGTTKTLSPPRTQIELTSSGDRIRYAADLYAQQPGSIVVACAGLRPDMEKGEAADRRETKEVALLLQTFGVPNSQIRIEGKSASIRKSAEAVSKLLQSEFPGTPRIQLVTSALEMRRAASSFAKVLDRSNNGGPVQILPRATDFHSIQANAVPTHYNQFPGDLIPSERALDDSSQLIQEQFVSVYYFLRGWLSSVI
jgi:uncharacterized SAM-binding protein YcdF (DUF218 family)